MMEVFPNPAKECINLPIGLIARGKVLVRVLATDGKVMDTFEVTATDSQTTVRIETSSYPSGVYSLQVIEAERVVLGRFVIR